MICSATSLWWTEVFLAQQRLKLVVIASSLAVRDRAGLTNSSECCCSKWRPRLPSLGGFVLYFGCLTAVWHNQAEGALSQAGTCPYVSVYNKCRQKKKTEGGVLHKGQNTERCLSRNLIWGVTSENAVSCAGRNGSHCCTLVGSFEKQPKCLCADRKPQQLCLVGITSPRRSEWCLSHLTPVFSGRSNRPICPNAALLLRSQKAHGRAAVQVYCLSLIALLSKLHVQAGRFG